MKRPVALTFLLVLSSTLAQAERKSFDDEIANLKSPSAATRARAARALGETGRREAIPSLLTVLGDDEPKVRQAAVDSLRLFKETEVVPGFVRALGDGDARVRESALSGIMDVYIETEKTRPIDYFLSLFRADEPPPEIVPFTPVEPSVFRALETLLHDPQTGLRRRAATALGLLKASGSIPALSAALGDPDREVRARTIASLGLIGGDPAGEALVSVLNDPYRVIRIQAVDALGQMGHRPAGPALLALVESEKTTELGARAFSALARIGSPEARQLFLERMTSRRPVERRFSVEGLGRLSDPKLAPGLVKDFLREPDPSVQLAYCFALVKVGRPEFVDRLALSLAQVDVKTQAHGYLVDLGRAGLPELYEYLSDPVADVRKGVAVVMMQLGDPASIPHLERLLSDPNPDVADRANRAIARLQRVKLTSTTEVK